MWTRTLVFINVFENVVPFDKTLTGRMPGLRSESDCSLFTVKSTLVINMKSLQGKKGSK